MRLLETDGSHVTLTAPGKHLYTLAESPVRNVEALPSTSSVKVDKFASGHLELPVCVDGAAALLSPSIRQVRDRYPETRVSAASESGHDDPGIA